MTPSGGRAVGAPETMWFVHDDSDGRPIQDLIRFVDVVVAGCLIAAAILGVALLAALAVMAWSSIL